MSVRGVKALTNSRVEGSRSLLVSVRSSLKSAPWLAAAFCRHAVSATRQAALSMQHREFRFLPSRVRLEPAPLLINMGSAIDLYFLKERRVKKIKRALRSSPKTLNHVVHCALATHAASYSFGKRPRPRQISSCT